ncbi:hypothetical protein [Paraburkholderia sp. C35]|uniref:hypothetical protein n=1 Tax=Paraburkholderia sp. C35 TaxID=2126993 RepID=UPI000D68E53F|nr:hypothetical protein [Paraburkholderia sp. C35]
MERAYPYKGYYIKVCIEASTEPVVLGTVLDDIGFVSEVKVFRPGANIPIFPPLCLSENDGRRFETLAEAILNGFAAGRRLVDEAPVASLASE